MAEQTVDFEAAAKEMGWVPEEQFRGDKTKWVDAETFVRRGEEIMPILKSQNKRLHGEVETLRLQLAETSELVKAGQQAIEALKANQTEFTKQAVQRTKVEIRERLRTARESGDEDAIQELEDQLDDIRDAERQVKNLPTKPTATPAPVAPPTPKLDPEFVAWAKENPWFGENRRRTALVLAEAEELRADPMGRMMSGRQLFEEATSRADATLNPQAASRVVSGEGSAAGGGGTRGGKKGYRDLPAEAKQIVERQAELVVGPGRAFKTLAEWQQHYADQYFTE